MKVLDPGYSYLLNHLDIKFGNPMEQLQFVKRVPGNETSYSGTTTQEVLRVLIDRIKYIDTQEHHALNDIVLKDLRSAFVSLEMRAAERHHRLKEFAALCHDAIEQRKHIEELDYCKLCGHIGCPGNCRDEN